MTNRLLWRGTYVYRNIKKKKNNKYENKYTYDKIKKNNFF